MGNVIPIHSHRRFSEADANAILPTVRRITDLAVCRAREIEDQLRFIPADEPLARRLRMELDSIITGWATKILRLGCTPRGIWLVDFDAGSGWFSWRHGDESLSYFHPHDVSKERVAEDLGKKPGV